MFVSSQQQAGIYCLHSWFKTSFQGKTVSSQEHHRACVYIHICPWKKFPIINAVAPYHINYGSCTALTFWSFLLSTFPVILILLLHKTLAHWFI